MDKQRNQNWNIEELMMAVNIYCKVPFAHTRKTDPEIIYYANLIGRSPGALYTKLCNFGRCDNKMTDVGIKGLTHGSHLEPEVWNRFVANPEDFIYNTEQLLANRANKELVKFADIDISDLSEGDNKYTVVKQRIGESFFRKAVLASFDSKCCVSKCTCVELLEACHISEWAMDKTNRLNPANGLCMNTLFHKAYDRCLMAITPDYTIVFSDQMIESFKEDSGIRTFLLETNGKKIFLPGKFLPNKDCLSQRYEQYLHSI